MSDISLFDIPDFETQNGIRMPVFLTYKTYGKLSPARDNAILIPTFYGGRHTDTEFFFSEERVINPKKHFVIIPNMIGNGLSISPTNAPEPFKGPEFPLFTAHDNVSCQKKLITQIFDIEKLLLVTGFSMGAQQAFQWGVDFSDMVGGIVPICGSARISKHNKIFLASAINTLKLDPSFKNGNYLDQPKSGLQAFGYVYSAWLFSQAFFREGLYLQLGLKSAQDVVDFTQTYFSANDANNLISMAQTWMAMDISDNAKYSKNFENSLRDIKCEAIVMPSETDLYFTVPDNEYEVLHMPNAELRVIPSKWGHAAGFGLNSTDNNFIDKAISKFL